MKTKKFFYVALILILTSSLLTGCGKQGVFFKRRHIENVDIYLISDEAVIKEVKNITDKETLDAIYKVLKNIRFDKKYPASVASEGIAAPSTYYALDVNLRENYGSYSLHIADSGKCYNYQRRGYEYYSLSGDKLLEIIENCFQEQGL